MAGGSPSWVGTQLSFVDTQFAKQGDLGSKTLPHAATGVVWTAGAQVEAKWSLRANHGGGYGSLFVAGCVFARINNRSRATNGISSNPYVCETEK